MKFPVLPPLFSTRTMSVMRISLSIGLHISYMVNAAAATAVNASISTPVRPWQTTLLVITISFFPISKSTLAEFNAS